MKKEVEFTPYDGYDFGEEVQAIKLFHKKLKEINNYINVFADKPQSSEGIANLALAVNLYDECFDLMGSITQVFSHHMMSRLRNCFGVFKWCFMQMKNGETVEGFSLGREVEQSLQSFQQMVEEWDQIVQYAESGCE